MELDPSHSLSDTLTRAMSNKTRVELHLRSGETYAGPVQGMSDDSVLIGPLDGKEFFDAQVRIADISAISVRARDSI